ncbi:hypothetical protein TCELL_1125 [Thermogladius calderae 1633]|uniref:Uncharacterized protein n=1 Tax=Thermogladius calderae (strain DSM 22663 / VKM B-2946 / 1633) TaxID=1184251 RepID=I3TFL0_THEC1|nr:hypothetical protein [Thermogladius calderae]AFK51548.1 hypothetical protein TCELL_1125 [Thermogladius calderae 1633]
MTLVLIVTSQTLVATVFNYSPVTSRVQPTAPPVTLQGIPTTYCLLLSRTSRGAIYYTDFEQYPPQGWSANGGAWQNTTGYKGSGLSGSDNNRGIGGASQYYYNTLVSSYSSLWFSVKVRYTSGGGYYGLAILDSRVRSMVTIEITTGGSLESWSYINAWTRLYSTPIPNYNSANWYVIVVNYTYSAGTLTLQARVYDVSGNLLVQRTWSVGFTPGYIALEVDGVTAVFDDFIISVSDPRYVSFVNIPAGYSVEVWDNLGNLVSSGVSTGATLSLNVVSDIVVGTGTDGRILVKGSDGALCLIYTEPDSILGDDVYSLVLGSLSYNLGANRTSISVSATLSSSPTSYTVVAFLNASNTDSKAYYARLVLDTASSSLTGLTANIALRSPGGYSTPIVVVNGVAQTTSTSFVLLPTGGYVVANLTGYATAGSSGVLNMLLEYCSLGNEQGVCVYYPVTLSYRA